MGSGGHRMSSGGHRMGSGDRRVGFFQQRHCMMIETIEEVQLPSLYSYWGHKHTKNSHLKFVSCTHTMHVN